MHEIHARPIVRLLAASARRTCLAALFISFAAIGCKSKPTAASDDASLTQAAQSKLSSDAAISAEQIQTAVQGGVAMLSGHVSSEAARSLAANDVAQVAGIRTVVNNLIVQSAPQGPVAAASKPAPIAPPAVASLVKPENLVRQHKPSAVVAPIATVAPMPAAEQADVTPPAPIERPEPAHTPPAPVFHSITLPPDTTLSVRITQTLDSATTQPGDTFSGVLASDVISDGVVVLAQGTPVSGKVDVVQEAAHFKGNSLLTIELTSLDRRGDHMPLTTDSYSKAGKGRGKNSGEKIGGGAAVGAILGGILGGGKGAAIGAAAGGGAGAGVQAVTKGEQVQIESESLVRFRLSNPITLRYSTEEKARNTRDDGDLQRHQ